MMEETALKLVETEPVEEKAVSIIDTARAVTIVDAESYKMAGELWKQIGAMMDEVSEAFDGIISKAHAAHKEAVAKKTKYYEPLKEAKVSVKFIMSTYAAEQEKIRLAEQRRLEEIARKAEEAARKAELDRLEAVRKAEEDRLIAAATAAEAAGDKQQAEDMAAAAIAATEAAKQEAAAIQAEPVVTAPIVLPRSTPKMSGGPIFSTRYDFEIIDADKIPRTYMIPDLVKIRQIVTALKDQANISGIRVFSKRV